MRECRGVPVDDFRKKRLHIELGVLLRAFAALPFVDLEIEPPELVRTQCNSLVVEKVGEDAVDVLLPLVGQDVDDGPVDVEYQSPDHRYHLLRHCFASWISRSR